MRTDYNLWVEQFRQAFPDSTMPTFLARAPGRTELLGNHTDHQQGCVLCGAVDLTITACVAPRADKLVRIVSEGFGAFELNLDDIEPQRAEVGTSQALIRGVAAEFVRRGQSVSGFDAYISSQVLSGSGLSSSAAFEILVANIFDHMAQAGFSPVEKAMMGQAAENRYFGKPCGLMDQIACSVGGPVYIDFADANAPMCEQVSLNLAEFGYAMCIVDTRSDHGDLTEDYAAIPREMAAVSGWFGKSVLRQVPEEAFWSNLAPLRTQCGDRAVLRAMHFFREQHRVLQARDALKQGDFKHYLHLVDQSGRSSELMLQNIWSAPQSQSVTLAIAVARQLLQGSGAVRVHGGGFAGTVQAYVPLKQLESFTAGMEAVFGPGCCHELQLRPIGGEIMQL